ncbi:MAG: hypothetical protein JWQ96_1029 [Segetibacter sp.]|nr:hypothetical protein [Segetibacter sp.]
MKKLHATRGATLILCLLISHLVKAQDFDRKLKEDKTISGYVINSTLRTPSSITFQPAANLPANNAKAIIHSLFILGTQEEVRLFNTMELASGIKLDKYKQYFKGIKVEHSAYVVASRNGNIVSITAESYRINAAFTTLPQLPTDNAKAKAIAFVGARKYAWEALEEDKKQYPGNSYMLAKLETLKQQHTPKAELVIARDLFGTQEARLAFKYDIYAVEPLSRHLVYVDALTGKILLSNAVIKHADKFKQGPKPDSLQHLPNHLYYGLKEEQGTTFTPYETKASVSGTAITRYAGVRQIFTTRLNVPLTGMQDPNFPSSPLTYSGVDPRPPVTNEGVYILRDDTRGGGIETYDCNNVGGIPLSLPGIHEQSLAFLDRDNNWKDEPDNGLTTREDHLRGATRNGSVGGDEAGNDDIAIDAHWGAGVVYDYWKQKHNRLSFDNENTAIRSYVHYGPAYDNAFWNGSVMTYGDGSGTSAAGGFRPLVSLDVCAHEIGHGVCSFTSDLVYQKESGAMNEGLSDIWAAAVERFAKVTVDNTLNYQEWQIGEQISADNIGLRRMDNPKAKTDPDTYGGRYWANVDCTPSLANDQCGVHSNSGVLNKWFYLLVQGPASTTGSPAYKDDGIADKPRTTPGGTDFVENTGNNYGALPGFVGLGFDKAEQITYMMELLLTPNATFADARTASINAAKVLYGPCSQEEITVTNAWFGVGVGAAWATCTTPTLTVNLVRTSIEEGSGDCGSFSEIAIGVSLAAAQANPTTITFSAPSGTAEAHDYQLTASTVTFNAGEMGNKSLRLRIFNDDMVEGDETINLQATSALGGFNFSQSITIKDDDVQPRLGNTFNIFRENFEGVADDALPLGWNRIDKTNPSGGRWNVRQSPGATTLTWLTKRAYVYNPNLGDAFKGQPLYDPNVGAQIILRTPLIDARGLDSIRLRFNWSAGGEAACSPACDYGQVVYSLDGVNFTQFDVDTSSTQSRSASDPLYLSQTDSTYDHLLPRVVSNRQFYIGFMWVNDDLATISPNSITIDNINMTGQGRKIETDSTSSVTTPVKVEPGNSVYFYSREDKGLLGSIVNASADLGCVKDTLVRAGNGTVDYGGGKRTNKVHQLIPAQNPNATYTLTLYYTAAELSGFTAPPSQLKLLKSNATDIDLSNQSNSEVVTPTFIDSSAQGFYGFSYTFTGFSLFAVVQPAVALPVNCVDFKVARVENSIKLAWKVASEVNNNRYTIERSSDGVSFNAIGEVKASAANNGSYTFTDNYIGGLKAAYYRLKQTDHDGSARLLCNVAYLKVEGGRFVTISRMYPNPAKNITYVRVESSEPETINVEIVNGIGQQISRTVQKVAAGTTTLPIHFSHPASGNYLVRFVNADGVVISTQTMLVK